ncbi:AfsR/SARP family transcriptional regulator [Streptomyces lavendulae]|uniref:AfsR/SARP family transcriptional regulator n=1 Tax=Streptomyces lavendulae TaxID=1914 RepID=UPI0038106F29
MELRLLGQLELMDRDHRPVPLPAGRVRIVLAVLALHAGHTVSAERLAEAAWGDALPTTARAQVQALVSTLRRALAKGGATPQPVETHAAGYRLATGALHCDLRQFTEHVERGREAAAARRPGETVRQLRSALALCRGPAFDGLPSAFLEAEAVRWEETRVGVLEECLEIELRLAPRPDLIAELRALITAHPLRESAHQLLMLGLHRAGRSAEALTAFDTARQTLVAELGVDPGPALTALRQRILTNDPALPSVDAVRVALFGRDADLAAAAALVTERRLVTLVGPPGVGKTQLALAVAAHAARHGLPDGVWTVELDAVTSASLVPAAVAAALGISAGPDRPLVDTLTAALADRKALVILDNCEHVLDACGQLAHLLATRCPGLRVLATSREPLAVAGEVVRLVEPLTVPAGNTLQDVRDAASGQMFLDRTAAQPPGLELTPHTAPHIARICRAVEGLPLALELVVAQLRLMSVAELADRIHRQLDVLARRRSTPDRHRSLEAAIDWSHRLLSEAEQRVLARLSVFAGGFTAAAAQAVVTDTADASEESVTAPAASTQAQLRDLVERSLIVSAPSGAGGVTRFRLLEPVREFAAQRLQERGEEWAVRARHAAHFRTLAEQVHQDGTGRMAGRTSELKRQVRQELSNVRAALDWSLGSGDLAVGIDLVGTMSWLWVGLPREGGDWVNRVLTRLQDAPPATHPRALLAAGLIAHSTEVAESAALLVRAASLAEETGDAGTQLEALAQLSVARLLQGRAAEAVHIGESVLAAVLEFGTEFQAAQARNAAGLARCGVGDLSRAAEHLASAAEVFVRTGARDELAMTRWAQAEVAYYAGEPAEAVRLSAAALRDTATGDDLFATVCRHAQHGRDLYTAGAVPRGTAHLHRALRHCLDEGLWMPAVDALTTAARIEADSARPERAVALLSAVSSLRASTGREPTPVELPHVRALARQLLDRPDPERYTAAQKHGGAMSAEQAVQFALAHTATVPNLS